MRENSRLSDITPARMFSRSMRGLRALAATLAFALAGAGLTVVATAQPAAAHHEPGSGNHFQCIEPRFFAQAEQPTGTVRLFEGSYDSGGDSVWTQINQYGAPNVFNALAFNPVDEFLYGVRYGTAGGSVQGSFVRIDASGAVTQLGVSSAALGSPPSTLWDSGEFDDAGNYYVASGNAGNTGGINIRRISGLAGVTSTDSTPRPALTNISLTGATSGMRYADLTFKDGFLWAVYYSSGNNNSTTLYRINVNGAPVNGVAQTPGTVNAFNVAGVLPASAYGSAFTMTNGNLAFVATNNNMYQVSVTNPAATTPIFELVSVVGAPDNARSNATNCSTALPASLSVDKVGPPTVVIGQTIEWEITVTNDGPGVSSGFVLTDSLPTGLSDITVSSDDSGCVINAAQTVITCNGGRLAVDETATVIVTATAPMTVGPVINSVQVIGNEDTDPKPPTIAETEVILGTVADQPASLTDGGITDYDETSEEGGTITRDGDTLTYTPPPGYSGYDSFQYTTPSGIVTVNITVNPTAGNDSDETEVGQPVTVQVLPNDVGTGLAVTSVGNPANGTAVIAGDQITYEPTAGFSGEDTFTYTVTDSSDPALTATATVTITVLNGFIAQDAVVDGIVTPHNVPYTIEWDDIVSTTGSPVNPAGITESSAPENGSLSIDTDTGAVTYTPDPGFAGEDSFELEVCDTSSPVQCDIVTIAVTVTENVVTAVADSTSTPAETVVNINVRANDTSASGQSLDDPAVVTVPGNGIAIVQSDGTIDYVPNPGFSGIDSFVYQVCDTSYETPVCDTGTVTITVTPTTLDDEVTTPANTAVVVTGADLIDLGTGIGLVLTSVDDAVNGEVELDGGGAVFTPAAGFSGTGSFTYTLTDDEGQDATGTITVIVTPITGDDTVTTVVNEDAVLTTATLEGLGTGTDLTLTGVGGATNGAVEITGGNAVFTPAPGFSGTASFDYTLTDGEGQEVTGTITVTVTPITGDDTVTTTANVAVPVTSDDLVGLGTGTDLTLTGVGGATNGTVEIVGGNAVFTPTTGFSGTASFDYTLTDGEGQEATGTITVSVTPQANDALTFIPADTPWLGAVSGFTNWGIGSDLGLTGVDGAVNGSVEIDGGSVRFTPDAGFSGIASFEFTLADGEGQDATATMYVIVTPTTGDDTVTTALDTAVTVLGTDLVGLGTGSDLELTGVGNAVNGTVEITSANAVFTPAPGFSGTASFDYTLTDGNSRDATGTITVLVLNDFVPGPAVLDGVETPHNTGIDIPLADIVDTDGAAVDPASVTEVNGPAEGTVSIDPVTGAVTYEPDPGFAGEDSFDIALCDTSSPAQCETFTIEVTVLANTVTAVADSESTTVGTTVNVDVRENDDSASGQAFANPTIESTPDNGTADVQSDGTIDYTPDAGFSGIDTFQYQVCDTSYPTPECDTATVTITVTPITGDDTVSTPANTAVTVTGGDLVDLGTGSGLELDGVSNAVNGTVEITGGNAVFTPETGFSGTASFEYTLTDDEGQETTGTITVLVLNVFVPGPAVVDGVTTPHNTGIDIPLADIVDTDGAAVDPASVTEVNGPAEGTVSIDPVTGAVTYEPNSGFAGDDSFDLQVCDTSSPTQCETFTIEVTVLANTVTAVADSESTTEGTTVNVNVRDNDTSASGQAFANPTIESTPDNGTAEVQSDGTIDYTPDAGFSGIDTFEYQVCDTSYPTPECDTATVTITVDNGFAPGDAAVDGVQTPQNSTITIELDDIVTTTGAPLDPAAVTLVGDPEFGSVSIDPVTGAVVYVPGPGYSGLDEFDIEVCDTSSPVQCTVLTIVVTVGVNTVTTVDDEVTTDNGESVTIDVLGNDGVAEGGAPLDPQSLVIVSGPQNGSAVVGASGLITYTPNAGFSGTDAFTYEVCDTSTPTPVCSTAVVTVTVLAATDDGTDDGTGGGSDADSDGLSDTGVEGLAWMITLAAAALAIGAALMTWRRRRLRSHTARASTL